MDVTRVPGIGCNLVKGIHKEHLNCKYKAPISKGFLYVGIDEFSIHNVHSRTSIIVGLQSGCIPMPLKGKLGRISPFSIVLGTKNTDLGDIDPGISIASISVIEGHLPHQPLALNPYHAFAHYQRDRRSTKGAASTTGRGRKTDPA